MPALREFVPDGIKHYIRLVRAKIRYQGSFVGSPFIGDSVVMGRHCSISRAAEIANGVVIGDFSYVNCGAIVASGKIGRFCSIGPYALVGMQEHPTTYRSTSPFLYGEQNLFQTPCAWNDFLMPPEIENDVWIGAHAFVRQGVRISTGAVVGAGAVVTHDIPPFAIVAGVPARILRYRFEPRVIEHLLNEAWWELDIGDLMKRSSQFSTSVEALGFPAVEEVRN
jgi:acetyltransferase-like isoleucine patch superfamily enzyme